MPKRSTNADGGTTGTECVKVAVRCRPPNDKENACGEPTCVKVDSQAHSITLVRPPRAGAPGASANSTSSTSRKEAANAAGRLFTFDFTYGPNAKQEDIFQQTAHPIVESVISGYNGTIFAYGQTGTGKTFTMEGVPTDPVLRGIMPNSFIHIFDAVSKCAENMEFLVRASFLEIYLDEVYDLLNRQARRKMQLKESPDKGVFVKDLSTFVVKSVPDLMKVLRRGQKSRATGATKMNAGSSRSHSILSITIETSETDEKGQNHYKVGKLNMVDLAGSERQKKTGATGERLDEAKSINLSLAALGNVIKALVTARSKHIPFRDSKLTRLLQDSLGGNTKTVMIANVGPMSSNFDETMSTLRYADRAKQIKNKPKINEDPKDTMLRECQEEIQRLKMILDAKRKGLKLSVGPDGTLRLPDGTAIPLTIGGGKGSGGAGGNAQAQAPIIEEKIIEKIVERDTGITEEDVAKAENKTAAERAEMEARAVSEKRALSKSKAAVEEQTAAMRAQLAAKEERARKEREALHDIAKKLEDRQKQLLVGKARVDEAKRHKEELQRAESELRAQREHEEKLKHDLAEAEEAELYMNEHYTGAKDELEKKTKKLKKLWIRFGEKKDELKDLQEEFSLEREDLLDTIRALNRQVTLKRLVMDSFIPPHYVDLIESHAEWDGARDTWMIPALELAGNNILAARGDKRLAHLQDPNGDGGLHAGVSEHMARDYYAHLQTDVHDANGVGGDNRMHEALRQAIDEEERRAHGPPKDIFYTYGDDLVAAQHDDPEKAKRMQRRRRRREQARRL